MKVFGHSNLYTYVSLSATKSPSIQ